MPEAGCAFAPLARGAAAGAAGGRTLPTAPAAPAALPRLQAAGAVAGTAQAAKSAAGEAVAAAGQKASEVAASTKESLAQVSPCCFILNIFFYSNTFEWLLSLTYTGTWLCKPTILLELSAPRSPRRRWASLDLSQDCSLGAQGLLRAVAAATAPAASEVQRQRCHMHCRGLLQRAASGRPKDLHNVGPATGAPGSL